MDDGMSEGQERESKRTGVIDVIQLVFMRLTHAPAALCLCPCLLEVKQLLISGWTQFTIRPSLPHTHTRGYLSSFSSSDLSPLFISY